jgi:hypothetical protein
MKKLLRTLFVMIVVSLVVAGVASYMSKKRLESKSDDEIREFLARKLDGKVGEEQLATIQDAVIGGIRRKSSVDVDEAVDETMDDEAPADEEEDATEAETDDDSAEEVSTEEVSAE